MQASTADIENARESLIRFFNAMREWENKHYAAMVTIDTDTAKAETQMALAAEELKRIFAAYCAPGNTDLHRLDGPSLSHPAKYDLNHGGLSDGKDGKDGIDFIFRQQGDPPSIMRFTMTRGDDGWRIKHSEEFDPDSDEWLVNQL